MTNPLASLHLRAASRVTIAGLVAILVLISAPSIAGYSNRVLLAFDAAALVYLGLAWTMILTASADDTSCRAAMEDPGRRFGFFVLVGSSILVMLGGFTWMGTSRAAGSVVSETTLIATIAAATLAWILTHTVFALRYAHMFYASGDATADLPSDCAAGLMFPGCAAPDDLDFAYFAITIGMTFQVSDVQITSRSIRRTVLWHALLSFCYNTLIVALILNLVFAAVHS
jgi:uncharacterized membrane protein